jgi:hypothetical protein
MLRRQEQRRAEIQAQVRRAPVALIMFDLADKIGLKGNPVAEDFNNRSAFVRPSEDLAIYEIVYETDLSSQSIRSAFGRVEGCEARRGGAMSLGEDSEYRVYRRDGQMAFFKNDEEYLCTISGRRLIVYLWFVTERADVSEYWVRNHMNQLQTPEKNIVKFRSSWPNSEYMVP